MGIRDYFGGLMDMVTDGAEVLVKARRGPANTAPASEIPPQPPENDLQSLLWDPFALLESLGYRERHSPISYAMMNQLAYRIPIFPPIMQTRQNQAVRFTKPQIAKSGVAGFEVKLRDHEAKATKQDRIRCRDAERWLMTCGSTKSKARDTFAVFLKKFVRDSLIYDQACFEIVRNKKGKPADFYAVDGGSFRIADTAWSGNPADDDKQIKYVQVHDESVIAELTPEQLCFAVRNPRTDLLTNGYGMSELEMGAQTITSILNTFAYNAKYFSQGSVAKGMLNLPELSDKKVRIFARQWHMIASGILNAWRTPITNFKDAQWLDFHKTNKDMEFGEWMNFLIKIFCALECIDPAEIHFVYGNAGQAQQLFQSSETQKLKASKDKGLVPLMEFVADCINTYLIWDLDENLEFAFTGLDPKDSEKAVDIQLKEVKGKKTVNEIRAEDDLPPLFENDDDMKELGDVILDPTWMQAYNAKKQQQQMEAMGGEEGEEGEEQGEGEEAETMEPEGVDMGDEDWESLLGEAAAKAMDNVQGEPLRKAHVRETSGHGFVEYDIEI
jgi:hypothetical protein